MSSNNLDQYGIKKIYPDAKVNPQSLFIPMKERDIDNSNFFDRIELEEDLTFNEDTSGNIKYWELSDNEKVRFHFLTSGGAPSRGDCDLNQGRANERGYMFKQTDWKNYEQTGFFFVKKVNEDDNRIILKGRSGNHHSEGSACCCGSAYILRNFWGTSSSDKGKIQFAKEEWHVSYDSLDKKSQNVIDTFYQKWFGVKMCVYNKKINGKDSVVIEHWLCPSDSPSDFTNWTLVNKTVDFRGFGWNSGGKRCGMPAADEPFLYGAYFVTFRWDGADSIQFKYLSVREIDPEGSFGDGGDDDDDNPDQGTPPEPSTLVKRITLRREIINTSKCGCGVSNVPSGGGVIFGSSGHKIYDVDHNSVSVREVKLAAVTGSNEFYIKYGQVIVDPNSPLIGKNVFKVEIPIGEEGSPNEHVRVRVRKGSDNTIATDLGQRFCSEIEDIYKIFVFQNNSANYNLVNGDRILVEYDNGSEVNFIKLLTRAVNQNQGARATFQDNVMASGTYGEDPVFDLCMRIYSTN